MQLNLFPIALLAAAVSAQTTSPSASSSACAAQPILEACLVTTQGYLTQCQNNDFGCLCEKYTAIVTCFNNCPEDSRSPSISNTKQVYCMDASFYSSSTSAASRTGSASATTTIAGTQSTAAGATGTGSQTASATGAARTNGGVDLITNASNMLVAVAGVVIAVL